MARHEAKKKLAKWQIALLVLLALVFLLAAAISGVLTHYLNKINRPEENPVYLEEEEYVSMVLAEEEPPADLSVVEPSDVRLPTNTGLLELKGDVTNVLLIGQDRRPGEGRARSDSIILCSINKTSNQITLVSFLRDLYVEIPGYQANRINASYAYGGADLLSETLKVNFGVEVDACVEVDFSGFTSLIDAMGGVSVYLTDAEYQYFQDCNRKYVVPGVNHFDGEDALFYSRIRDIDSDFGRTNRQRNVLTALFNQVRNAGAGDLLNIANALLPLLTVDLTNGQILSYVVEFAPMLSGCSFVTGYVPVDGNFYYASINGMSVIVPDLTACRAQLQELLSAE